MKSAWHTGAITTLGRGGSDLTATVLGAALGVAEVQVWKDVDGELSFPRPCCMPWYKGVPRFRERFACWLCSSTHLVDAACSDCSRMKPQII